MWKVYRHGGRRTDRWRMLIETPDESKALDKYEKVRIKLRQGRVVLVNPEGDVVKSCWAPTLRTRW